MKNIGIIFISLILFSLFSCKKEEKSISHSELTLKPTKNINLNIYNNDFKVEGKIPSDFSESKVTLHITSNADSIGFKTSLNLTNESYTEGKYKYLLKTFFTNIYAANYTDSVKRYIKVSPVADVIKVRLLTENNLSRTINIDCNEVLTLTYWPYDEATIFLWGHSFNGNENKTVQVWSGKDPNRIQMYLEYSDPTIYQGLPAFNNYSLSFDIVDGPSSSIGPAIGVNRNEDRIYVLYNELLYYSNYKNNTFMPLRLVR